MFVAWASSGYRQEFINKQTDSVDNMKMFCSNVKAYTDSNLGISDFSL